MLVNYFLVKDIAQIDVIVDFVGTGMIPFFISFPMIVCDFVKMRT